MARNYFEMTTEELQQESVRIQQDACNEYKAYVKCEKYALLQIAQQRQRTNDLSLKTSKRDLIDVILDSSHYCKITAIEKVINRRQNA
jgi:hypothetical protein